MRASWSSMSHCCDVTTPPGMRTRIMKAKAFSIFLRVRSGRRSRSSCRYMPWNLTSCWSSSTMAPVISSRSPALSVPRRKSLASLMRSLREISSVIGRPMAWSVCVLEITLVAFQRCDCLPGSLARQPFYVGIGAHQGRVHVLGHIFRIATDIEVGATIEPFYQLAPLIPDLVLHIDLLRRVAREGDVHAGERAIFERFLPVELVQEVVDKVAVAEE